MMQIGCRAHDFGCLPAEELAGRIGRAGFETVQLALPKAIPGIESYDGIPATRLAEIRRSFDNAGVGIAILGCYIEPALPDQEERQRQVEIFIKGLECAKEMGVPIVGTETTNFPTAPSRQAERAIAYQHLKERVLQMARAAERLGVTVAIEPVTVHTLSSAHLARRLLDEVGSERVRIIFDPVNMIDADTVDRQDETVQNFFDLLGKDIVLLHAKDMVVRDKEKDWANIGAGVLHQEPIYAWLKENKPDIPVIREEVFPDSAAIDVAALRQLVAG